MAMFSSSERLWNESERLGWGERNESSEAPWQDDERNYYAMLYSLLILAIVFGNVLVCLAVLRERSLQTTTNYLVVSLAVSDLLVASLVMPWAVYLEVSLHVITWRKKVRKNICVYKYFFSSWLSCQIWHWFGGSCIPAAKVAEAELNLIHNEVELHP